MIDATAAKPTPRPWRTKGRTIMNADGIKIATATIHSGGKNFKPDEIAEANARLIAAAPDLLHALIMVRDADNDCHKDGLQTIPPVARHCIDAAIAKAEGGDT